MDNDLNDLRAMLGAANFGRGLNVMADILMELLRELPYDKRDAIVTKAKARFLDPT